MIVRQKGAWATIRNCNPLEFGVGFVTYDGDGYGFVEGVERFLTGGCRLYG